MKQDDRFPEAADMPEDGTAAFLADLNEPPGLPRRVGSLPPAATPRITRKMSPTETTHAGIHASADERIVGRFREAGIALPTFEQLADPGKIPQRIRDELERVDPDAPHPLNLFRVHWYNASDRRSTVEVPEHVVLPRELTGVDARIVVALGDRFPMIGAHKVLAAYACLVPRLVTGRRDGHHSTGRVDPRRRGHWRGE